MGYRRGVRGTLFPEQRTGRGGAKVGCAAMVCVVQENSKVEATRPCVHAVLIKNAVGNRRYPCVIKGIQKTTPKACVMSYTVI